MPKLAIHTLFSVLFFLPHLGLSQTLIVLSGGYGSCAIAGSPHELNIWPPLREIVEGRGDVEVVRSCFALTRETIHADHLVLNDKGQHSRLSHARRFGHQEFYRWVTHKGSRFSKVVYIGQSYGGWLAMQLTLHSAGVSVLVTIDPISLKACSPGHVLSSPFTISPACQTFPPDVNQNLVSHRAHHWLNFYQRQNRLLRSSDAALADTNIQLVYDHWSLHPFGAHASTETDERVWASIATALRFP